MKASSQVDFLVMGAGVAGLRAAVELARHGEVLVVTKESVAESNTHYAQGGIAVAMEGDADVALHLDDTVNAGDGLVYRPAAQALVAEGPVRVAELIEWGANFDTEAGELLRTREGAHSLARILHANGDATGAEIGRVIGADLLSCDRRPRLQQRISARAVLIAAGGAGQVYSDTTNPAVATGDGIALAAWAGAPTDRSSSVGWQAGAALADMEFYQFHPTALSLTGAPRFLLSEALRGEGAILLNDRGERFMQRYHPLLELAPRDVVARAIAREGMGATAAESRVVHLDMRAVKGIDLHHRFPGISAVLERYSLDLGRDLIPVRPAAHYLMGGIRTDLHGRTTLAGLYAAGEAACNGVHGANRLASNSLLEGLVFGARAAQAMLDDCSPQGQSLPQGRSSEISLPDTAPLTSAEQEHLEKIIANLQASMWAYAGLLREDSTLRQGLAAQQSCADALAELAAQNKGSRRLTEALAMSRVAQAILASALARTESRGAHFRNDFPQRDDLNFQKHSLFTDQKPVVFQAW